MGPLEKRWIGARASAYRADLRRTFPAAASIAAALVLCAPMARAATLTVGPGVLAGERRARPQLHDGPICREVIALR
jgi:hypothetical protein